MASRRPHPLEAVLFDLDGTLIDSAPDLAAALNRLLAGEGRRELSLGEVVAMIGDGAPKLIERAFAATGDGVEGRRLEALRAAFLADYEANGAVLTRPYPGVVETLERLTGEGLRLGLCTNKPGRATRAVLAELGLAGHFGAVLGGDELDGVRKPDPRHLLALLELLGAGPERAAMVGDSENDVAAARAAGLPVIVVAFGYAHAPPGELGAEAVIERFTQLPEALRRLA